MNNGKCFSGLKIWEKLKSSVIRQKGESQNGCFKKTKHAKFFEKRTFLASWYARAYQGVRNVRFSENLACFVFLKHPFWDSPFCLITDDLSDVEKIVFKFSGILVFVKFVKKKLFLKFTRTPTAVWDILLNLQKSTCVGVFLRTVFCRIILVDWA